MRKVILPPLHPGQTAVRDSPARFRVLAAGRRWGKTRLGVALCVKTAGDGGRAWWVAPTFPIASIGWREVKRLAAQIPGAEVREVDRIVTMPGGGWVQVKSGDNPDSLRGEGLDLAVLDECSFISEEAWQEALRPALSDRKGGALFISTPKGRNWFWRVYLKGQEGGGEWQSWQFPTVSNPYIDPKEVEAARQELPESVFAQEYLAAFMEDAGQVFRRVTEAMTAKQQDGAQDGHHYIMGVDWGKHEDFTVLTVLDTTTNSMAAIDRFNQIDYTVQTQRLKALAERFHVYSIIAERNSMGEPLIEQLQRDNLPVQAYETTNATKAVAIDALALAFERGSLQILRDPILVNELQAYAMERLPSGLLRYSAPAGLHDDCVISLALAWQGAETGGSLLLWGAHDDT